MRVDPPSKWTFKDSRGQAWIRQYRSVDPRGSKRDPSKTAFTRNRLCFPRSKWSTVPPKPAFAGASFGGSRSMVKPALPGRSSTVRSRSTSWQKLKRSNALKVRLWQIAAAKGRLHKSSVHEICRAIYGKSESKSQPTLATKEPPKGLTSQKYSLLLV